MEKNKKINDKFLNVVSEVYEDCVEAKGILLELKVKIARGSISTVELLRQLTRVIEIIDR